jgi:ribonuclease T
MTIPAGECVSSVDTETSGPIPGRYSLLSLGACVADRRNERFYLELRPLNENAVPEAVAVTGLDLKRLVAVGVEPAEGMKRFRAWVASVTAGDQPVFVGFNAGFDWSFVNWYFHTYLGENIFGFAPLDIKSLYMGLSDCSWADTKSSRLPEQFRPRPSMAHNAEADAVAQAEVFCAMVEARELRAK